MNVKLFPDHWKTDSVSALCTDVVDCVNKTAPIVDGPTEYKMIRTTNVKAGRINLDDCRYVDEATFVKWTRRIQPKRDDIVLTREAPLGEVGLLRSDESVFLGQRTMLYRANPKKLDQRFLYYSMLGPFVQGQIRSQGSGATVEHLRVPDAELFLVAYPPLEEQRRIAALLSAYDDLIANNQRRIVLLESMAEEIYREWFVRMRFPGYDVSSFDKGLPAGWSSVPLGQLIGEAKRPVKKGDLAGHARYVGLEHISRMSVALTMHSSPESVESDKLAFKNGDILFSKIRPYLHKVALAHFDGICSTDTLVLKAKRDDYRQFALFTVFSETFIEIANTASKGTKMPRADWHFLKQLRVSVPSDALLQQFGEVTKPMLDEIATLIQVNESLMTQRDALLPRLISGKLRVDALEIQLPPSMQQPPVEAAQREAIAS